MSDPRKPDSDQPGAQAEDKQPQVYALVKGDDGAYQPSRRGFLRGMGLGALGLAAAACTTEPKKINPAKAEAESASFVACGALRAHDIYVADIFLSSDGKHMLSSGGDNQIKLWSLAESQYPVGKIDFLASCRFGVSAKWDLLAYSKNGEIVLSGLPGLNPMTSFKAPGYNFKLSPQGDLLAGVNQGNIDLWSVDKKEITQTLTGLDEAPTCLAFSGDGRKLAAGDGKGNISVFFLPSTRPRMTFRQKGHRINHLSFTPDAGLLATYGSTNQVWLWDLATGECPLALTIFDKSLASDGRVRGMELSPDGKLLAAATHNGTIQIWSLPQGEHIQTLKGHDNTVHHMAFDAEGTLLASGDQGGRIRVWKLPEGEPGRCYFDPARVDRDTPVSRQKVIAGSVCICDTITVTAGQAKVAGATCTCDTVSIGTKVGQPSGGSGGGMGGGVGSGGGNGNVVGHYWRPN